MENAHCSIKWLEVSCYLGLAGFSLALLHSERPKLHTILAFLSAIELMSCPVFAHQQQLHLKKYCGIKYTVDGLTNISGLSFLAVISIKKIP